MENHPCPSVGHELKCGCRSNALWKANLIVDPQYKIAYTLWALYAFDYDLEKHVGEFIRDTLLLSLKTHFEESKAYHNRHDRP